MSRGSTEAVIGAYDFSAYRTIVDVGGGHGLMLAAILSAHPGMRGTPFDQPAIVARAKAVLTERCVIDRCDIIGGNFFETAPKGGDVYLMRQIVHDREDDDATAILKVCRRAMRETANLLVIEQIVGPANEKPAAKFSDLNMLVAPGGRERTREEYAGLLTQADFELTRVVPAGEAT
jgi:O-methyltransferase domain